MRKKNQDPLVIVVKGNRWDAFGSPTPRSQWLYATLKSAGGIAESVEDGTYHFNVKRRGFHLETSLIKIED
jgi:hypothetical protein